MRKIGIDRYHKLVGMLVICNGVSFNRNGEYAWIIGISEGNDMPYCIGKSPSSQHGIMCYESEVNIVDSEYAKIELQKHIQELEEKLERSKSLLRKFED